MTKTISTDEITIQKIIVLAYGGDEIVLGVNGELIVRITTIEKPNERPRILGLR